jgi:hypothetical protein
VKDYILLLKIFMGTPEDSSKKYPQFGQAVSEKARQTYPNTHICFCGEGPRSRCYERTAALRLNVQPCDEDG